MMSKGDAFQSVDGLLREIEARWPCWRAQNSEPADSDEYTAAIGELIEDVLPAIDATLQRLAVDPRI